MKELIDIVHWLRKVELLSSEIYRRAAETFNDDKNLKNFFHCNAEDEAWHYHVMGSAAEYLSSESLSAPAISVDRTTDDRIVGFFNRINESLDQKMISKSELLEKIVEVELSEWNDIFLYVVNVLKEKSVVFGYPLSKIQNHVNRIKHFFAQTENGPNSLKQLTELPPIWVENILIVDDQKMITDLIKSLLNRSGNIDVAHNGQEALELINKKYFKLILSDVDMPVMDGITFYQEAVGKIPELKGRFLFMTGNLSPDRQEFFEKSSVKCLPKPMDISVLKDMATDILLID